MRRSSDLQPKSDPRQRISEWLEEQDKYWISKEELEEEFGLTFLRKIDLSGVTMKEEDGKTQIPKRDLRKGLK